MRSKFKNLTLEQVEKVVEELYKNKFEITYDDLRIKALPNYSYKLISPETALHTNQSGLLMILNECEEIGIPAFLIGEDIIVHTNKGELKLIDLKVNKIENGE